MRGLTDITDGIARALETVQVKTEEALFEPVIRLGVTGLSRAGKTVFITSLVANLLNPGRMPQMRAVAQGRFLGAFLQPQPNDAVARFAFEDHLGALTGPSPVWPQSTRSISQLRLSLRVQPTGFLTGFTGPRTLHLDIVDYPGEWLLDLALLDQDFASWSATALRKAEAPPRGAMARDWHAALSAADPQAPLDEVAAQGLARAFTGYLRATREAGFSDCTPGRFLLPGDLDGSPALTFAPLPPPTAGRAPKGSLHEAFERRYEAYKRIVVKPFFQDHFSRIERQVVLVDALTAINAGPPAVEDLRGALAEILSAFRPGTNSWLSSILGKRVERIAFAATKADCLHHTQHDRLTAIMNALVAEARQRAAYKGAATESFALAALRSTVETQIHHEGEVIDCVRGRLARTGREAAMFAGLLPEDPAFLLSPAAQGQQAWLDHDFALMDFAPPLLTLKPGMGPPHIRMDRLTDYLIGDRLL